MLFDRKEYEQRIRKLRLKMEKDELDAIVLMDQNNKFYTSGTEADEGAIILPLVRDPIFIVTPKFMAEKIEAETWIDDVRPSNNFYNDLAKVIKGVAKRKLGLDNLNSLSSTVNEELQQKFRVPIIDVSDILMKVREIKSQEEIQVIKETARLNSKLDRVFFETLRENISEREIYAELIYATHQFGGDKIHISMTTGFPNYWMHYKPYPRRLKKGDLVFCEIAPQLNRYWTETVRMAVVGNVTREFRDLFEIEVDALDNVIKALRPGAAIQDVYKSLLDFVDKARIALLHYTDTMAHGAGLFLDDLPNIKYDSEDNIVVGQNLCIHPNLLFSYIGSIFNVGEQGIITEKGCEIITERQTELIAV